MTRARIPMLPVPISHVAAALAVLMGGLVLTGWALDISRLKSLVSSSVAMNPTTALVFILLGVALWLAASAGRARPFSVALGATVALVGAVKFFDLTFGWHTGLDELVFREALASAGGGRPIRMALNTSLNFVLLGTAIAFCDARTRRGRYPAQWLVVISSIGTLLPVLGYQYGIAHLYAVGSPIPMSLPTALTFLVLNIGAAFVRPARGLPRFLNDDGVAGMTVRRLLPAAILVPASLGWIQVTGQHLGWYDAEFGVALLVVAHILVFGALVGWSASRLRLLDQTRLDRAAELVTANALLHDEAVQRRHVQGALDDVIRRERATLTHVRDLICSLDEEGRFTTVNPAALDLLGYRPDELIGQRYIDQVAPEDVTATRDQATRVMAGQEAIHFENRYRHKSGAVIDLLWTASWSSAERSMFCVARDNTEPKRAAAVLQQSRDYLDRIINAVADPIFVVDRQHRRVLVNDAYCQLVGRAREHLLTRTDGDLFPAAEAAVFSMTNERVFTTGQELVNEETFAITPEAVRILVTRKRLHFNGDAQPLVVGVIRDITEDRQRETELRAARDVALESLRLKAEFLANMSHEIRTPMNGVLGMTALLLDTELSGTQHEYATAIHSSADGLLAVINDILDFSKSEAGQLRVETIDFDLREVVEASVAALANPARAKGLELASLFPADVPRALRGDPGRLKQILTNLVGNAVKFTAHGEVIVRVSVGSLTDHEATLRIEVIDTGIGITPDVARTLFRPFNQGDNSTTRRFGGTGLGLAISKQLILLMGGEIGLTSIPEAGTTFWMTVTLARQPSSTASAGDGGNGLDLTAMRLLIVAANNTMRRLLGDQASAWGLIVEQVASPVEAIEALHRAVADHHPHDIVILDVVNADDIAVALCQALTQDAVIGDVRVVVLSSTGRWHLNDTVDQTSGVAAHLQKPVRPSQLYACLQSVMAPSATGDAAQDARHATRPASEPVAGGRGPTTMLAVGRILLADDVIINQKVAVAQLAKLGYQVDVVSNGLEAVSAMRQGSYALVLMDCQMPEMDGYLATAEIRRIEGSDRRTPVIAMTASVLPGDRDKCLAAGMDDFLSKPVNVDDLRQMLERWLVRPAPLGP